MAEFPESSAHDNVPSTLVAGVTIIAVIVVAAACYALREVISPFLMAVFLLLAIGGFEGFLARRTPLPHDAALPVAILLVLALFGLSIWLIIENSAHIVAESGAYADRLDGLLKMAADKMGLQAAPTIDGLFHQLDPGKYAATVAAEVGHLAEGTFLVLIYLGFMLASRVGFGHKLNELFPGERHDEALAVIARIQNGVEGYVSVQTLAGVIIALGSAMIMAIAGLSHIWFWAFLIFLANYIPVFGVAIGVLLPTLFGLVELDAIWKAVLIFVGMEAVHFVTSHVLLPRMQGRSLNIDPLIVLLSLAFWGAIFGAAGAFLSTPLTVIVMVICAEIPGARAVAVLLSGDGKPGAAR